MFPRRIKDYKEYIANRIMRVRNSTIPITTQQELADYLKVEKSTISQYENGINMPNVAILLEIAAYFGMTLDQFLELEYDPELFKKAKNAQELGEEILFLREFQHTFRNIDSEGKKLLLDMAKYVKSRYRRDFEKEQSKEEVALEDRVIAEDYKKHMEQIKENYKILRWAELDKVGRILKVQTDKEAEEYHLGSKKLPPNYTLAMSEEEYEKSKKAYLSLQQELYKPFYRNVQTPQLKPGLDISIDDLLIPIIPINKKRRPR
jgi:transcriptional regulator with XRE-family HTH domain